MRLLSILLGSFEPLQVVSLYICPGRLYKSSLHNLLPQTLFSVAIAVSRAVRSHMSYAVDFWSEG
jgi:hypothetical protein